MENWVKVCYSHQCINVFVSRHFFGICYQHDVISIFDIKLANLRMSIFYHCITRPGLSLSSTPTRVKSSVSVFLFFYTLAIGSKTFYFGSNWLNIFWSCRRLSLSINTIFSKSSCLLHKHLKKHRTRNKLSLFYIVITIRCNSYTGLHGNSYQNSTSLMELNYYTYILFIYILPYIYIYIYLRLMVLGIDVIQVSLSNHPSLQTFFIIVTTLL